MDAATLKLLYGFNYMALQRNTEGLSHEDSLVQPQPAGNCLNWVLGHILAHRNDIMKLLGEGPAWEPERAVRYGRGAPPLTDGAEATPLDELQATLAASQERLNAALDGATPERLAEPREGRMVKNVGESLAFLQFHEAYHVGQVALLRRAAGKEGAIR